MKNWFIFYITLLIALLVNGYFGIYKETWIYAEAINLLGISLWLDVELDLLWSRVKNKDTRPLLKSQKPYETLKKIHIERQAIYKKADISVKASSRYTVDDMAQKVIDKLELYPDLFEE